MRTHSIISFATLLLKQRFLFDVLIVWKFRRLNFWIWHQIRIFISKNLLTLVTLHHWLLGCLFLLRLRLTVYGSHFCQITNYMKLLSKVLQLIKFYLATLINFLVSQYFRCDSRFKKNCSLLLLLILSCNSLYIPNYLIQIRGWANYWIPMRVQVAGVRARCLVVVIQGKVFKHFMNVSNSVLTLCSLHSTTLITAILNCELRLG